MTDLYTLLNLGVGVVVVTIVVLIYSVTLKWITSPSLSWWPPLIGVMFIGMAEPFLSYEMRLMMEIVLVIVLTGVVHGVIIIQRKNPE